jgi:hypothetical protein
MMSRRSALVLTLALLPQVVSAQGIRINGISTARYIEVRPLLLTTDPASTREPLGLVPLYQDLFVNAWGLGQGIRLYAHVRGRAALGDAELWPQSDDAFDALAAYIEVDRPVGRVRLGRQWTSSHLAYYNFDGVTALWRPTRWFTGEVYGGWALAPGLNEFLTSDALAAVEPFAPDRRSNLLGAQVRFRAGQRFNAGAEYQREIRTDRAGLYGERIAGEAALSTARRACGRLVLGRPRESGAERWETQARPALLRGLQANAAGAPLPAFLPAVDDLGRLLSDRLQ